MCGIAGAIGALTPSITDAVRRMHEFQAHRGPDGEGFWTAPGGDACFAHRRLAIIDLSDDGRQPMTDHETGNVIVFNGEIYNYRVLREELRRDGAAFHTQSDTEVILRAYARWGPSCVERLRGMFTFALWDARDRTVLLARDHLGIKPLYYVSVQGTDGVLRVLFASEMRAILETGLVPRRIDRAAIASYLWNGFVLGDASFIAGIRQFPAGSTARLDPGNPVVEPRPYWSLPGGSSQSRKPVEARDALAEAVGQHLISDVPVGVFLSGGVDSSAVAAMACRVAPGRVTTFNVSFDEAGFDESPYARRVARQLGTEHHELRLTQGMFREHLADALDGIDQPTFDGINTYFVSRVVRESGVKVALAGTGGDELFGGYRSFAELPRVRRAAAACRVAPRGLVKVAAGAVTRWRLGASGDIPPQTRWGKLADVLTSGGRLLDAYQVGYGLFTRDFLAEISPHSNGSAMRSGLPAEWATRLEGLTRDSSDLAAISMLELSCFLGERLLRDTDATSMAVALEVRVPLLDHEFVEVVAGLPDRDRFEPVGRKMLLRDIALDGVDPDIFDRPKAGFVLPFEVWCRESLYDEVAAAFADRALCESVGVRSDVLLRLLGAFVKNAPGMYWSRIWSLYILLWWARRMGASL